MTSAYGTLTKKAFSSVETLNTILEDLPENFEDMSFHTMEVVFQDLKAMRDELLSALRKVALASTTECPLDGKTKSNNTSNDIPDLTQASAEEINEKIDAAWTQLVNSVIPEPSRDDVSLTTESAPLPIKPLTIECICEDYSDYCAVCW